MKPDVPEILLVNPWIHDFAAYDFWAKPLGLLTIGAILRSHGFSVRYIDCLDRFHPRETRKPAGSRHGRGPYRKTRIPKPEKLADVPRNFSRYGIDPEWFEQDLRSVPKPDLVLVTSLMTYWYPGVGETIGAIKKIFPETPVVLGGIYAGLCREHAEKSCGADRVVTGPGETRILEIAAEHTGFSARPQFDPDNPDTCPFPAFDLQRKILYAPIMTSVGCPFSCSYCASRFLQPKRKLRSPESVVDEIRFWQKKHGVNDFVFYDDALLADAENHALPLLEAILRADLGVRFHTPNAVHIRGISKQTAELMFRTGFTALRLGLETAVADRDELDSKTTWNEFVRAVELLKEAGFSSKDIGAYLLFGLPDQPLELFMESILKVREQGIKPVPAYYTPIPHTALWERAKQVSKYDPGADPIFTNNAAMPCFSEFSWDTVRLIRDLCNRSPVK